MSEPDKAVEIHETSIADPAAATAISHVPVGLRRGSIDEDSVIRSGKLAGKTMWQAVWILAWPVLIESFLTSLVGVTDTALSAGISQAASDGIGGAAYFMWFVGLVVIALGVGAMSLIARGVGRGRLAIGSVVVGQCASLSLICGIVVAGFAALIAPVICDWLSMGPEARAEAITYIRLCALGAPLQSFAQVGIACCRGAGDSLRPLFVMVIVNVINVVLSFLLSGVDWAIASVGPNGEMTSRVILENPSPLKMGVAGIALGTVIAWAIGAAVVLVMLSRGVHGVRLRLGRMKPHWHTVKRLLRLGLPNLSETFGMWMGNFILIMMVGWMGSDGYLGSHVIAVRIEAFSFLPGFAMGLAAATLSSTYLGAGSTRLARKSILRCMWVGMALMGGFGLMFMIFPRTITGIFSQQPVHLELVPSLLVVFGSVQAIFAISIVLRAALRGTSDTKLVMWITWISTWVVRMPLAWICCGVDLPLPWGGAIPNPAPLQALGVHPLIGFEIGLCLEILIRAVMFLVLFFRGRWMTKKV